ncbi:hypothetical protein Efla_003827 [Eimeria flavescens]
MHARILFTGHVAALPPTHAARACCLPVHPRGPEGSAASPSGVQTPDQGKLRCPIALRVSAQQLPASRRLCCASGSEGAPRRQRWKGGPLAPFCGGAPLPGRGAPTFFKPLAGASRALRGDRLKADVCPAGCLVKVSGGLQRSGSGLAALCLLVHLASLLPQAFAFASACSPAAAGAEGLLLATRGCGSAAADESCRPLSKLFVEDAAASAQLRATLLTSGRSSSGRSSSGSGSSSSRSRRRRQLLNFQSFCWQQTQQQTTRGAFCLSRPERLAGPHAEAPGWWLLTAGWAHAQPACCCEPVHKIVDPQQYGEALQLHALSLKQQQQLQQQQQQPLNLPARPGLLPVPRQVRGAPSGAFHAGGARLGEFGVRRGGHRWDATRGPRVDPPEGDSLESLFVVSPVGGSEGGTGGLDGERPGALQRLTNLLLNSSIADKVVSLLRYFVGPIPGRPDKALLRQSDSVGIGVGIVLHMLRTRGPEESAALSEAIREAAGVRQFIRRFAEAGDPTRSVKASLQQLLWVRRSCARLALGSYGGRQQAEFLTLLQVFREEYMHLLGFLAACLRRLPASLPALGLFVDRLLVPLQDSLRSLSSVAGRFPGLRVTLVQQQLLRWISHLTRLDAALMPLVPGGLQTLASLQARSSLDSSLEETDSRHNSQEELTFGANLDSHL